MSEVAVALSVCSAFIWLLLAVLPWQPWSTRETFDAAEDFNGQADLQEITVVIPARNEEQVIAKTLQALTEQGQGLQIIVVDDHSEDATAATIHKQQLPNVVVISAKPLPKDWTGKLWALQQGLAQVESKYTLLLDADIELLPGVVSGLLTKIQTENRHFISLMAHLRFASFWERLLMPSFIYFFKMLYPFALANKPGNSVAAAAGGCILVETACLREINAMDCIKNVLIDDCSLAGKMKSAGFNIWVGLTHSALSQRPYPDLKQIWDMVARTAYSQLLYSILLLLLCTGIMVTMYLWPLYALFSELMLVQMLSAAALVLMILLYWPTLQYYGLDRSWSICMPLIALLYIMMTWTSAIRYWKGERSRWKGRVYQ